LNGGSNPEMLVEGNSLPMDSRLADVSINTVTRLLLDLGSACEQYQDKALRGFKARRIQCDEIWAFVYAKARTCPRSTRARSATATCGRGRPSTATRS
jgi:hypothetical protein